MNRLTTELAMLALGLALGLALAPWRARLRAGRVMAGIFSQSGAGKRPILKAGGVAAAAALTAVVGAVGLHHEIPFTLMGLAPESVARGVGLALGGLLVAACVDPARNRQWGPAFVAPLLGYALGGLGLMVAWSALRGALWGLQGTALGGAGYTLRQRLDAPWERLAGLLASPLHSHPLPANLTPHPPLREQRGGASGGKREAPHPHPLPGGEGEEAVSPSPLAVAFVLLVCVVVVTW